MFVADVFTKLPKGNVRVFVSDSSLGPVVTEVKGLRGGVEWVPNSVVNELRVSGSSVKVRKSENGQAEIAIWASTFMGGADVAYNLAYFKAVCQELPMPDVLAVAERERQAHRWQPNRVMISATSEGVILADRSFVRWNEAAASVGKLVISTGRKEGLLDIMRRVYTQANGDRQYIARVGQFIRAM